MNKSILYTILLGIVLTRTLQVFADSPDIRPIEPDTTYGPAWVGWTMLGVEYIVGPVVASHFWWQHAFGTNPFGNIGEKEPYLEDKIWHFWNGENVSHLHYWVLHDYFGKDSPWGAMGLTMLTLTAIELLDASDSKANWELSICDQLANMGGIAFWYLKHKYPQIPVDVRIGIRRWDRFDELIKRSYEYPSNFHNPPPGQNTHLDNYSILKAEIIVRPYNYFYIGFVSSLKHNENGWGIAENLFGVTAGFDALRWYANKYPGKITPFTNTFGRYVSESIATTHWFEENNEKQ